MDEKDVYQIANGAINLKENIKADIRIFDIRGRLISELKDVSGTVILNIPDEKLLFINISNNDFNITEKLIR